jgi:hypothetical protein
MQETRLPRLPDVVIGECVLSDGDRLALETFFVACQQGSLYEMLMCSEDDRQVFKKRFFAEVFFGRNQVESNVKYLFGLFFPPVARMLRELKRKDYRRSAWVMQSYEATIFIRVIAERIRRERPDLPVYTIHDSFLTVPDGIDYVEDVVRDEFRKIGIHPCLRREP